MVTVGVVTACTGVVRQDVDVQSLALGFFCNISTDGVASLQLDVATEDLSIAADVDDLAVGAHSDGLSGASFAFI